MKFLNKGGDIQVRLEETNPGYNWKILRRGETIDLPETDGINHDLEKMETTKGKIGKTMIETKQIDNSKYVSFWNELLKIKGVGINTAKDIIAIFKTKDELLKHIKEDDELPLRNDIDKKLREHYG